MPETVLSSSEKYARKQNILHTCVYENVSTFNSLGFFCSVEKKEDLNENVNFDPFLAQLDSPTAKGCKVFYLKWFCVCEWKNVSPTFAQAYGPDPISSKARKTFLISLTCKAFIIHLNGISFNNILVFRVYPIVY